MYNLRTYMDLLPHKMKGDQSIMKRLLAVLLCILMTVGMVSFAAAEELPTFDGIQLGVDYVDLQASIKMLTHRTDLEGNGTLAAYVAAFNEMYPGITVQYEAVTDYAGDALIRLAGSDNWGDIMMIPEVDRDEYPTYFAPLGDLETMKETYNFIDCPSV